MSDGPMFEAKHWRAELAEELSGEADAIGIGSGAPTARLLRRAMEALEESESLERIAIRCWKTEVEGLTAEIQQWRGELEAVRERRAQLRLVVAVLQRDNASLRAALQAVVDAQHPMPGDLPGDWLRRHDTAIEAAVSALLEDVGGPQ